MLARIFTEPEVRDILRRYDPKEKWRRSKCPGQIAGA